MRLFTLLILSLTIFSCDKNHKTNNSNDVRTIEIFQSEGESDIDILLGNESFDNNEALRLNNIGIQFIKKNQFKKAEKNFLAAYEIEPKNPTILTNLGNIYREIGTEKMALEYYNEAFLISDSTYFNAAYNMGISYCSTKEYEKSNEILEYIIGKTKDENEITFSKFIIIRVFLNQNKCENAKKLYNEIKSDLDKFPGLIENRVKLEQRIKNCVQQSI
jgi:tetratricopeptide (TPR) repeat protein